MKKRIDPPNGNERNAEPHIKKEKKYETLTIETIPLEHEDVILTSNNTEWDPNNG